MSPLFTSPAAVDAELTARRERLTRDWGRHHAGTTATAPARRVRSAAAALAATLAPRPHRHA